MLVPFDNTSGINTPVQQEFIGRHGDWVQYYPGMKCPNTLQMTGSDINDPNRADLNCPACRGLGWIWPSSNEIRGVVSNISQHKDLIMAGIANAGDLVFSPDLRETLSDYDKIQFTWPEGVPFEGDIITRGTGTTDTTYYTVLDVYQCVSVNPTTGVVTTYQSGVDFTFDAVNPTNQITWLGSNQPATGTNYSIKYAALMDWIVFSPPQPRRERGTNLGQRVILRKKHVVFNGV